MGLKRKQIYIDPESDRKIKKLARATGLSEAEHIRIRYDDGHARAMIFDALIQEMVRRRQLRITWITPSLHELAMEAFRRYTDQELSVVDCSSLVVAKEKKIREVFGFDSDFAKLGFILRP